MGFIEKCFTRVIFLYKNMIFTYLDLQKSLSIFSNYFVFEIYQRFMLHYLC